MEVDPWATQSASLWQGWAGSEQAPQPGSWPGAKQISKCMVQSASARQQFGCWQLPLGGHVEGSTEGERQSWKVGKQEQLSLQ
jgi:hypothetical protein